VILAALAVSVALTGTQAARSFGGALVADQRIDVVAETASASP